MDCCKGSQLIYKSGLRQEPWGWPQGYSCTLLAEVIASINASEEYISVQHLLWTHKGKISGILNSLMCQAGLMVEHKGQIKVVSERLWQVYECLLRLNP